KIYKTLNDHVEQYQNFTIKDNGYIEYVGDPIIAFESAKFFQQNTFNLSASGSLFYTDILTPGYSKEDKAFTYTYMHLLKEMYDGNEIVTFDNFLLDPTKNKIDGEGHMEDYTHLRSSYFILAEVSQSCIDDVFNHIKH